MNDNFNSNSEANNNLSYPLPNAAAKTQEQWHRFCAGLLLEIERLRGENEELREQRRALAQMVPIPEDVRESAEKSFEELMAMCEGPFSLAELILEIEQGHGS